MPASGRILVVDDEPGSRLMAVRVLRRLGVEVRSVSCAAEALASLEDFPCPGAALVDISLPDGPGTALVARLRERVPGLRVLYVSGHDERDLAARGVDLRGEDFLGKPFRIEELSRWMEGMLAD